LAKAQFLAYQYIAFLAAGKNAMLAEKFLEDPSNFPCEKHFIFRVWQK